MRNLILIAFMFSFTAFSQTEKYEKPIKKMQNVDIYKQQFEIKNYVITPQDYVWINAIDFNTLVPFIKQNEDFEYYHEPSGKTIILYSYSKIQNNIQSSPILLVE